MHHDHAILTGSTGVSGTQAKATEAARDCGATKVTNKINVILP